MMRSFSTVSQNTLPNCLGIIVLLSQSIHAENDSAGPKEKVEHPQYIKLKGEHPWKYLNIKGYYKFCRSEKCYLRKPDNDVRIQWCQPEGKRKGQWTMIPVNIKAIESKRLMFTKVITSNSGCDLRITDVNEWKAHRKNIVVDLEITKVDQDQFMKGPSYILSQARALKISNAHPEFDGKYYFDISPRQDHPRYICEHKTSGKLRGTTQLQYNPAGYWKIQKLENRIPKRFPCLVGRGGNGSGDFEAVLFTVMKGNKEDAKIKTDIKWTYHEGDNASSDSKPDISPVKSEKFKLNLEALIEGAPTVVD